MPDLVHKKVQAKAWCLAFYVLAHLVCEILDGDIVLLAIGLDDSGDSRIARYLCVGRVDMPFLHEHLFAPLLPALAGNILVGCPKVAKKSPGVQIPLELRNIALLAVVAAHFVEDLDEYPKYGIRVLLVFCVRLLINVEQNAFRGDLDKLTEISLQHCVVFTFFQEYGLSTAALDVPVFKQKREHFQQM